MSYSQNEDFRPNPEDLLDRYQLRDPALSGKDDEDDEESGERSVMRRRGRLRVYLGMSAGVGKTYAMLNEGHRRKIRGTDVVIGFVETHGRPITEQQIGDLEIIPRKVVPYRGITLQEMDVEAIIARRPQVALVDELAHTNVPCSKNTKRYQDVEELQNAGITVVTTLNIQHLEGLNDIIESITAVRQRETLPDSILDGADEVELIDIAPDALRARLRHGNVYPPDRAQKALEQYFSLSNLTALRELALRRVAEKTEDQLEILMRGDELENAPAWGRTATERVMVAIDSRLHSKQLLRDGWRLARGLKAPIIAVTVAEKYQSTEKESSFKEVVQLAGDLGVEIIYAQGDDIAAELAKIAREFHVTQIVIGQPSRTRWQEFMRRSVVNRLLRLPTGADIHVVPYRSSQK